MVYSSPPSRNEALVMIDTTVDVINKLGLHARASGKLIEVTTKFRSSIRIGKADKLVDAKISCHCSCLVQAKEQLYA